MIPYEDLVTALTAWRARNGLPTGAADFLGEPEVVNYAALGIEVASAEDLVEVDGAELVDESQVIFDESPAAATDDGAQTEAAADLFSTDDLGTTADPDSAFEAAEVNAEIGDDTAVASVPPPPEARDDDTENFSTGDATEAMDAGVAEEVDQTEVAVPFSGEDASTTMVGVTTTTDTTPAPGGPSMVEVAAADGAETVDVGSASSELAIGQALGDGTDLMDNEQQATAGAQQPPAMVASPGDETAEVDIADLPPDSEAPVVDPSDEST